MGHVWPYILYSHNIMTVKGFLAKEKLIDPTIFFELFMPLGCLSSLRFAEVEFGSGQILINLICIC